MKENEQYYVCAAWLRESTNQWEFYSIGNQIEFPGQGYPVFSSPNSSLYRLWFCNTWDYTHENGWECMDRAGMLWENKEYSVGYRHWSGFAENWVTQKGEKKVSWSKHRGTGFTLHRYDTGKGSRRAWYLLKVVGGDEILGSLGNNYFWHAKVSDSKSRLLFRFSDSRMDCGEKFL